MTIEWPSGKKDMIPDIKPNRFVTVQEGKGIVSAYDIVKSPKTM